jgi:hypothetical protein
VNSAFSHFLFILLFYDVFRHGIQSRGERGLLKNVSVRLAAHSEIEVI